MEFSSGFLLSEHCHSEENQAGITGRQPCVTHCSLERALPLAPSRKAAHPIRDYGHFCVPETEHLCKGKAEEEQDAAGPNWCPTSRTPEWRLTSCIICRVVRGSQAAEHLPATISVAAFHLHLRPKTLGCSATCSTHMLWAPQANTRWASVCGAAEGNPLRQLCLEHGGDFTKH